MLRLLHVGLVVALLTVAPLVAHALDASVNGDFAADDGSDTGKWHGSLSIGPTGVEGLVTVTTASGQTREVPVRGSMIRSDVYLGAQLEDGSYATLTIQIDGEQLRGRFRLGEATGSLTGAWEHAAGVGLLAAADLQQNASGLPDGPADAGAASDVEPPAAAPVDACTKIAWLAERGREGNAPMISSGLRASWIARCNAPQPQDSGGIIARLWRRVGEWLSPLSAIAANLFINNPSGPDDALFAYDQAEMSLASSALASNNRQTVVALFNDKGSTIGYATSGDGGGTWTDRRQFVPSASTNAFTDPVVVSRASDGAFFAAYVTDNGMPNTSEARIAVAKSSDGGATFGSQQVLSPGPEEDKPWIAIDTSSTSPCLGTIYVCYTDIGAGTVNNEIRIMRSTDDGASFGDRTRLSSADANVGNCGISTDAAGTVYAAWYNVNYTDIRLRASTDCGVTWSPGLNQSSRSVGLALHADTDPVCMDWALPGHVREAPEPIVAGDPRVAGSAYIVWHSSSTLRTDPASMFVYFARTTNYGSTWSVSAMNPIGESVYQPFVMTQVLSGSPIRTGIFVHWNRYTTLSPPAIDVYANESVDGGVTWQAQAVKLSTATSPIPDVLTDCFFGDYLGGTPAAGNNQWLPAWVDTRRVYCSYNGSVADCSFNGSSYVCPLNAASTCRRDTNVMTNAGC